jgi:hypothetical protein
MQGVSFQSEVKHPCVQRYARVCVGEFDQHKMHIQHLRRAWLSFIVTEPFFLKRNI